MRHFRLCRQGVDCDATGLAISGVALLERACGTSRSWRVRTKSDLENELCAVYGASIDIESKLGGLGLVAEALTSNDLARAQVATLLLQFPDPPAMTKAARGATLNEELFLSGLLKDEDFETKHPRTGTSPYPNRFASKPKPDPKAPATQSTGWSWPSKRANSIIRRVYDGFLEKSLARPPAEGGEARGAILLADLALAVWDALRRNAPGEDFDTCQRLVDAQLGAASSPPQTLEQLQIKPCDDEEGFEQHHIVEQTPANLSKLGDFEIWLALKFGADVILHPDNTVWIPRLLHEKISTKYSEKFKKDPADPTYREDAPAATYRQVLSEKDFYSQRQAGLQALRDFGALK